MGKTLDVEHRPSMIDQAIVDRASESMVKAVQWLDKHSLDHPEAADDEYTRACGYAALIQAYREQQKTFERERENHELEMAAERGLRAEIEEKLETERLAHELEIEAERE